MSKTINNTDQLVKLLQKYTDKSETVLKKAAAKNNKQTRVGVKTISTLKAMAEKSHINFTQSPHTADIQKTLETAWEIYQKAYEGIFNKRPPKSARTEFEIYFLANKLDLFDPKDTLAAYFGGDIRTDNNQSVQIKREKASLVINYTLRGLEQQVSRYAGTFDVDLIEPALKSILEEGWRDYNPEKITLSEFMKEYLTISVAEWYLFKFETIGFWVSVPKTRMIEFVEIFPDLWKIDKKSRSTKQPFQKIMRFMGTKNTNNFWDIGRVSPAFFIHHPIPQLFYQTRGVVREGKVIPVSAQYTVGEIVKYNQAVSKSEDFWDIHNSFFGPIKY